MTDAHSVPCGTVSNGTYAPTGTASMRLGQNVTRRNDKYEEREEALDRLMRDNLAAELKRLKISKYRLAKLAGVSSTTITRFLTGGRGLGKMTLHHLVNAGAGLSVDRLMAGKLDFQARAADIKAEAYQEKRLQEAREQTSPVRQSIKKQSEKRG